MSYSYSRPMMIHIRQQSEMQSWINYVNAMWKMALSMSMSYRIVNAIPKMHKNPHSLRFKTEV